MMTIRQLIATMKTVVRFRVDLTDRCSIGPGKIDLLERIRDTGSLSQAGRELGMSYRRAWLLLDSLNTSFREPVVATSVGGKAGGGASLTDLGKKLVAAYRALESEVNASAVKKFAAMSDATSVKKSAATLRTPLVKSAAPRRAKTKARARASTRP